MATTKTAIATMKVAQISRPGGEFEIVEREIPKPADGQVGIKVQACGICHSDAVTKDGMFPWIQYPRIPGHEVVGTIDELGAGVSEWKQGQRVGIGWHGGHDGVCLYCRRGDFRNCKNVKIPRSRECRCVPRPDRSHTSTTHFRRPRDSRLGGWDACGFRGYPAILRTNRRAGDD